MIKGKFGVYEFLISYNPYKIICEDDFIKDMLDTIYLDLYNPLTTSSESMGMYTGELQGYLILNYLRSLGYDIEILQHDVKLPCKKSVIY